MSELLKGQVKWFNDAKGFGFIEHESGKDVFVHYSVIEGEGFKTLKDGEDVQYSLGEGEKGLNASRVLRISQKAKKEEQAGISSMIEVETLEAKKAPEQEGFSLSPEQAAAQIDNMRSSQ